MLKGLPLFPEYPPSPLTWLALAVLMTLGLGVACAPQTPEGRVRALLSQAEQELEARDGPELRGMMSEGFIGRGTLSREAVMAQINRYLLTHRQIEVTSRVTELEMKGSKAARSVVYATLVAQPVDHTAAPRVTNLLRLDLELATDDAGAFRVTAADWRSAESAELVGLATWSKTQ